MRIIGPPSADIKLVRSNAVALGADPRFVAAMLQPLWDAGLLYGIDPVGVVAQSAKETNWGRFGGNVRPDMFNTAGIKNRHVLFPGVDDGDRPLAHARFANWAVGAMAHCQHLRAYTGWPVTTQPIVDPRYDLVTGTALENFEELGGRWAPSPSYGTELVVVARRLQATS